MDWDRAHRQMFLLRASLRKLYRTVGTHTKSNFELPVNSTNWTNIFYLVRIGLASYNVIRMKVFFFWRPELGKQWRYFTSCCSFMFQHHEVTQCGWTAGRWGDYYSETQFLDLSVPPARGLFPHRSSIIGDLSQPLKRSVPLGRHHM